MEYIKNSLIGLKCRLFSPIDSSLCAFFDFGKDDAIAFRADCDALPIFEKTGADYASTHSGAMHACGHDGHMAILLELARRLNKKEALPHNVLLIFQPAEETIDGAKWICRSGVLESHNVKAIFGLHIWPELAAGEIFSRRDEMLARSCEVKVDIYGKSAHIAKAREGIDAMAAGAEFYRKACAMEGALPKKVFRLLKFGKFESGTVCNAISGHTHMEGSLRAFQDEIFYSMRAGLVTIAKEIERGTGCTVTVDMNDGYPAVMNPAPLYDKVKKCVSFHEMEEPSMIAEDFAWYQKYVPGVFFFLGAGDVPALHADDFNFDESILVKGADFFEALAEHFG
jgi:hippurate hydrolase